MYLLLFIPINNMHVVGLKYPKKILVYFIKLFSDGGIPLNTWLTRGNYLPERCEVAPMRDWEMRDLGRVHGALPLFCRTCVLPRPAIVCVDAVRGALDAVSSAHKQTEVSRCIG